MPASFSVRSSSIRTKRALILATLALIFSLGVLTAMPANAASLATLQASSTSAGLSPTFSGNGFSPSERVDLWLTAPSGTAMSYGYAFADSSGNFSGFTYNPVTLDSNGEVVNSVKEPLAAGTWEASARGVESNSEAVASFTVAPATLQASTLNINGNQITVQYDGANFYPGEKISLWLTNSSGSVIDLGYCWATNGGQMPAVPGLVLDANGNPVQPTTGPQNIVSFTGTTGQYKMTAYGAISGQTAITDLKV